MVRLPPKIRWITGLFFLVAASLCSEAAPVILPKLARLPLLVQQTILAQAAGGRVRSVDRAVEDGQVVYEVEIQRNGRVRELTVGSGGELLDMEIFMDEVQPVVQRTILQTAGAGKVTDITLTFADGKSEYDVLVMRDGRERGFTVATNGELVDQEVFFEETSDVVRKVISAQVGNGKPLEINQYLEEGETYYEVEMARDGKVRYFTVNSRGELARMGVFLEEVPVAVQKTIHAQIGNGTLKEIEKFTEDGEILYDVELVRNGRTRSLTVNSEGELVDAEVFLDEVPPPVKQAIQSVLGKGRISDIYALHDEGEITYEAEIMTGNHSRIVTCDATGQIFMEEEEVPIAATPEPVKKTIQALLGTGTLGTITRTMEDQDITFAVEIKQDGQRKSYSLDAIGRLQSTR